MAFFLGCAGFGKTYLSKQMVARSRRLIVADVTGDYADMGLRTYTSAPALARDLARVGTGPFRARLSTDLAGAAAEALAGNLRAKADAGAMMLRAAAIAFTARDMVLLLDELALCCGPNDTPPVLRLIAGQGRHSGLSVVGTSQRPAMVSRVLTSQSTFTAFFRLSEPLDIKYARERIGMAANRLPALGIGQALAVGNVDSLRILEAPKLDARRIALVTMEGQPARR